MKTNSAVVARPSGWPPPGARPLVARWRARHRARRLYEWARAIDIAPGDRSIAQRAARLYQRGLRSLRPTFPSGIPAQGLSSRGRLEWALAMSRPWRPPSSWSPRRRACAGIALAALAVTMSLIALGPWRWFSRNVALAKPWRASSAGAGFPAAGHIEAAAAATAFMHTEEEERPSLVIDLNEVRPIGGFEIENRRDCCAERTVPLAVETSSDGKTWTLLAKRTAGFSTWFRRFAPTPARYVRIQVERRSILHLSRVKIHGG